MTKSTSNLVGLFLVLDSSDHESCRTGQIVAAVGNGYLIQCTLAELPQATKRENLRVQDWNSSSDPRHINAGLS
jgi:hypothetical protein